MSNILRYILGLILTFALFQGFSLNLSQDTIQSQIEKRIPIISSKKGIDFNLSKILIDVQDDEIFARIAISAKIDSGILGFFSKAQEGKVYTSDLILFPEISGTSIYFTVNDLTVNGINFNKAVPVINYSFEKHPIKIKQLEKYSFFITVDSIQPKINEIQINWSLSTTLIIISLLILFLREIGIFFIILYQKFLSPRKGYSCAKHALHGEGSCSTTTLSAFKSGGFISGINEYRRSTRQCKESYRQLKSSGSSRGLSLSDAACIASPDVLLGSGSSSACEASACDISACDAGCGSCEVGSC